MQSHFATKSWNLHLHRGANGDAIGSPFKCKVPFGKARGPAQAPNRRTSHIRVSWRSAKNSLYHTELFIMASSAMVASVLSFCASSPSASRAVLQFVNDVHLSSSIYRIYIVLCKSKKHAPLTLVLLDWSQAGRLSTPLPTRSRRSVFTASPTTSHRQTS
jgi:hypothetical protein